MNGGQRRILAGHLAARALAAAGIEWVTGVAGESFLPLLDGLRRERLRFISTVHESGATFLASAHARTTGSPAVVAVTRGPGASNALIGVHEAAQAGAPLVVIVGQVERGIRGRKALQEMEFTSVFGTTAKAVFEVLTPDQVAPSILAALRLARLPRRGPVVVSVPADLLFEEVDDAALEVPPRSDLFEAPEISAASVSELADLVHGAERGLLVVGEAFASAAHATLLEAAADAWGFGIVGGHAFPDVVTAAHPLWIGVSTIRGSASLRQALCQADLLIFLGHGPGDRVTQGYQPLQGNLAIVRTEADLGWDEYLGAKIHVGDPVSALKRLLAAVAPGSPQTDGRRRWVQGVRMSLLDERESIFARARAVSSGVPYPDVVDALDACIPPGATITSDAGSFNDWITRYLPFGVGRRYCGTLSGSMGFGVPAAVAVQLARPEHRAVALTGDGGFLMTGLELATAVRMRLPITVVVFRNEVWGSIALHQDRQFPGERFGVELPQVSFAALARAVGATAETVSRSDDLLDALAASFRSAGPSLLEIVTDGMRPSPSSYDSVLDFGAAE